MNSRFNGMTEDECALLAINLERDQVVSKRDGCAVVVVECVQCGKSYEEEIEAACVSATIGENFFCLACDDQAVVPAFVGVTIQIGFFRD